MTPGEIQAGANIASVLVALGALFVAFRVEGRNQKRFEEQLVQSRKIAETNMKPLLYVYSQTYTNLKSVKLANRGAGTAIITRIELSKGDQVTRNLRELFDLDQQVRGDWDTSRRLEEPYYLRAGDEIDLVKLSEASLLVGGKRTVEESQAILDKWQDKKTGIKLTFDYEDIFGNKQSTYSTCLL